MMTLEIDGRLVGEGQPFYIIADAGADAVKFQKRTVSDILIAEALTRPYTVPTSLGATYGEHREKLELSTEDWAGLRDHARSRGITLLASAWDMKSVDLLDDLGIPAFKIASADCSNLPLVEYVA